jgi:hypothetical protein
MLPFIVPTSITRRRFRNFGRHPQLIEAAGGQCVTGVRGGRVEVITLEQLAAVDPEVIIFVPCGYDLARGAQELLNTSLLQSEGMCSHLDPSLPACSLSIARNVAQQHLLDSVLFAATEEVSRIKL